MIEDLLVRLNLPRRDIFGCDAYGEHGKQSLYLRRFFLWRSERLGNLYLHVFHRSDDDRALHDHPWPFVSMILSGGYIEHTHARSGLTYCAPCYSNGNAFCSRRDSQRVFRGEQFSRSEPFPAQRGKS